MAKSENSAVQFNPVPQRRYRMVVNYDFFRVYSASISKTLTSPVFMDLSKESWSFCSIAYSPEMKVRSPDT